MVHTKKGKIKVTTETTKNGRTPHIRMGSLVHMSVPQLIMIIGEFKRRWTKERVARLTYCRNAEKSREFYRGKLKAKNTKYQKERYQVFKERQNNYHNKRVINKLQKDIEHIKMMKKKQFMTTFDSQREQTQRNPKLLRTIAWARILHRTNIIVRQSAFTRTEMIAMLWMYQREYVTTVMFVHEMNDKDTMMRLWMKRLIKKGWVNVEKRRGIRTKIYYLTPVGVEMTEKVINFVKKNPSKKRK